MAKRRRAAPKKKTAAGKRAVKAAKAATKAARKTRTAAPKKAAKKAARRAAKKAAPRKAASRKPLKKAARKVTSKAAAPRAKKAAGKKARVAPRPATTKKATAKPPAATRPKRAKRPAPIREAIPSSLSVSQGSSAARSGREDMVDKLKDHNETGPAITGGDLDANWEVAYSSGDEAPGGDNPTPDQDVVDDIGHALGIEYESNEELKGAAKLEERDRHRWELDPASAEDYPDHEK